MKKLALIALVGMLAASVAVAEDVDVTEDIAVSTLWTADNTYHLKDIIYISFPLVMCFGTKYPFICPSNHFSRVLEV